MRTLQEAHAILKEEGCADWIGLGEEALGMTEAEHNGWLRTASERDLRDWCASVRNPDREERADLERQFRAALSGVPALSRALGLLLLVGMLPGCAGSFELSRGTRHPRPACVAHDQARAGWANLSGVMVLASGLDAGAALVIRDESDRALAIGTGAAAAAVALVAGAIAEHEAQAWARECAKGAP